MARPAVAPTLGGMTRPCLVLLLLAALAAGQEQFSDIPLGNPFNSSGAPAVSEVELAGKVFATIDGGDFVHPTFSPDGKTLAYSRVLLQRDFETTEVWLYNLGTGRTSVLLNSTEAEKYATYKAFVTGMEWRMPRRLEVLVSDGDVDSTRLSFDPRTWRLLRLRHEGGGETESPPMSPALRRVRQRAVALFPAFPRRLLDNALANSPLVVTDKGIVLQKNYHGHDDNVWLLDFESKSTKPLVNLSDEFHQAFNGGLSFKSSILLLLSHGRKSALVLYRDGKIKRLAEFDSNGYGSVEVKHRSPDRVIFLVKAHASYERGDNPLFVFDGERLSRVKGYRELYDAEVDPGGRRIAFCYWEGGQRHLAIKELN